MIFNYNNRKIFLYFGQTLASENIEQRWEISGVESSSLSLSTCLESQIYTCWHYVTNFFSKLDKLEFYPWLPVRGWLSHSNLTFLLDTNFNTFHLHVSFNTDLRSCCFSCFLSGFIFVTCNKNVSWNCMFKLHIIWFQEWGWEKMALLFLVMLMMLVCLCVYVCELFYLIEVF